MKAAAMMDFEDLPRREKAYMLDAFGLPDREDEILRLRYVDGYGYPRIAAEMHVSESSVGALLTRARKHMVEIAKQLYPIADERTRHLVDVLGWVELEWPTLESRRRSH